MIYVKNLIIHEIIKQEGKTDNVRHTVSESLLEVDSKINEMITDLDFKYSSFLQILAVFNDDVSNPDSKVPEYFRDWRDLTKPNYTFLEFSQDCTKNLEKHIEKAVGAKGGYLVFTEYSKNSVDFMGVFFVRNRKGSSFNMDGQTKTYRINESIYIDIEHMAMAARINLIDFTINNRYISFIHKNRTESQYFLNWFCADDRLDNKEDTKTFYKLLYQIDLNKFDNLKKVDKKEFINTVYTAINNSPKKGIINLKDIGKTFFDNEHALTEFANEKNFKINHEFKIDKGEFKKFVNINVKEDSISLIFPLNYIQKKIIRIHKDSIIINSKALVEKISLELKRNE